jgi:hypothetical protein
MQVVCVENIKISLSIAAFISKQNKIQKIYTYNIVFAVLVYISIEKIQKLPHLLSFLKPR